MDLKSSVNVNSGEVFVLSFLKNGYDCGIKSSMLINTVIQTEELGTTATCVISLLLNSGEEV